MDHYFFNVHNDDETVDFEGRELADDAAAHAYAIAAARVLAGETASQGHLVLSHSVEILDGAHKHVRSVSFGEAVEIRP